MKKIDAITRAQAALDAQNAINLIWDGSPHTAHLFREASNLIDKLYNLGEENQEDAEFWARERHAEDMGDVSVRVNVGVDW